MTISLDPRHGLLSEEDAPTFNAVFIRAPAVIKVCCHRLGGVERLSICWWSVDQQAGPAVQVLATLNAKPHASALAEVMQLLSSDPASPQSIPALDVVVAMRQGNILATAFHPELTNDLRWHKYVLTSHIYRAPQCSPLYAA
jgi:5'-phosphate synthase pdxT subunit